MFRNSVSPLKLCFSVVMEVSFMLRVVALMLRDTSHFSSSEKIVCLALIGDGVECTAFYIPFDVASFKKNQWNLK